MINYHIHKDCLEFYVLSEGAEIAYEQWRETNDIIYFFILSTLVDNGNADVRNGRCILPCENLYFLDREELTTLKIPASCDKQMRLRGEGMLTSPDFKYIVEFLSSSTDGDYLSYSIEGNIIYIQNEKYLLNEVQYQLLKSISTFESTPIESKSRDFNLRCFANIKELAVRANCDMDSYLKNEDVQVPPKIKVDIRKKDNGYQIVPSVISNIDTQFQHSFEKTRKVTSVYPTSDAEGHRTRVVFAPEQTEGLKEIKAHQNCSFSELSTIVNNPTEYFNPEIFDLSELYSDRVIEYGLYKPHFSPFVSPYKSCWIPGADVTTPSNGTKRLLVENAEELLELQEAIKIATIKGEPVVRYKGAIIDIDDARFFEEVAVRQLSHPGTPVSASEIRRNTEKKILIIKENEEELTYSTSSIDNANSYTFHQNSYFDDSYSLKSHQIEGIAWLQFLWHNKASGGLLADDMGLGKTLQVLYFIDWQSRQDIRHNPYLIVAPVSLLENWQQEYLKFFKPPRLKVQCLTGKDIPRKLDKDCIEEMQNMDIVLTNYETVRNCQLNICAVDWEVVVLDESQKIKTPGTMVTIACKALKSKLKIAMTGTPVENSLIDLWCIMDFCVPGLLGSAKEFSRKYVSRLEHPNIDLTDIGNEIRDLIGEHILRRQKQDVAKDLPTKTEHKEALYMPEEQRTAYNSVVDYYRKVQSLMPSSESRNSILQTLFALRKISEHPFLYLGDIESLTTQQVIATSARLILTETYLDAIKSQGDKVIIFADHKDTQQMLQQLLFKKYGIVAMIINGDTPSNAELSNGRLTRQASIDKFQASEGFNVIIMSPIAAGIGLNVTAANHVIHYSRHWNPAKENQATDRAYRIGQLKDVHVYYPMAVLKEMDTFDVVLDHLLERKSALASSTIFPTERMEITQEEIINGLFGKA